MARKYPGEDVFREFQIALLLHNEAVADRLGLQPADVAAAVLLDMRGPLSVGALAQELGLPSASTTRLIDRLEKAGYVRRVRGERDRRTITVELVKGGLNAYDAACEISRRHLESLGLHYTPDQITLMIDLFHHVTTGFRTATKELRETPPLP
ncbi:MarR family transcriptional regulator [Spongiactinospora rosea]|uniref:MarR family transcriptional regulator n=1 Tax=Spongiactinospora rosea TaxID=2248750 RepID=A0A366LVP0_9ACTN|nr:MarR family transcriptional regulator [Spongiactinospora rosea]RBQ17827.1 MarR family transcriptional regulator [Spongiactinospora rosea]